MLLASKTYHVDDIHAAQELYHANGWTDGLPIVPPTADAVQACLDWAMIPPDQLLGIEPVRALIASRVLDVPRFGDPTLDPEVQASITNFKSALQELAQSRKLPQPRYAIVEERGPEHSKTFTVEVRVGKEWTDRAEGASKKVAAQRAAQKVYRRLREDSSTASPTGL